MRALLRTLLLCLPFAAPAKAEVMELFVDADYSVSFAAAESIELGVRTALNEAGNQLGGHDVVLVRKDHRGNVKRSHRTMQQFLQSDRALLMIGGLHSPPYITHRDYMNDNGILTLLPWSAGAPITRQQSGAESWLFRVSVDDSKSGEFFVRETVEQNGCRALALVLLDTGWGRAGESAIAAALASRNMQAATTQFFPFSVGEAAAGTLAASVAASGADCAVLMANAGNGAVITRALFDKAPGVRIFSHWGIMGAAFPREVPHALRAAMDLRVLQTCALRIEARGSEVLRQALAQADPDARSVAELGTITGFVHGYDMTRILIAAAGQAASDPAWQTGTIAERRVVLKAALETLKTPVEGILKTYDPPFRPSKDSDHDAHEALGLDDLCMARFREDGFLQDAS